MKFLLVASICIAASMAQKPFYAGISAKGYPELASRFRDTGTSTEVPLANRVGDDDATSTTIKIPVDALGDVQLVQRVSQWPRENQPFWLINAEHLERHRHPETNGNQNGQVVVNRNNIGASDTIPAKPTPPRSSFLGPIKR